MLLLIFGHKIHNLKMNFLKKNLVFVNLLLMLFLFAFLLFKQYKSANKVAFVYKQELFDDFQMTKESKKAGELEYSNKKKILDSLYVKLQGDIDTSTKEILMKEFIAQREEFDEFNRSFALQESDRIWERLREYTKKFAEEKGYEIILDSEKGYEGSVIFADDKIDVTKELLEFVNKKYSGL